ncbi:hypothetical protein HPB52_004020 [Rhipicephalus sanguineus]|uniref:Uncharacterized protein n=1 Tax=Rhipicephalus sanguineus TaxID=34632 RepID=A0A9D4PIT6_RHISA|nr:hypothetical protein HPB52_004020 [Rhipicephalus sanguineus]
MIYLIPFLIVNIVMLGMYFLCRSKAYSTADVALVRTIGHVTLVPPTISACLSAYSSKYLWTVLIWCGGTLKAASNVDLTNAVVGAVNAGVVPPQHAAAAVNWADRLWVFATADVLLGLLPYFGEREYLRGHAAIVAVALVVTVVGLSVRVWLVTLVPPTISACLSAHSSKYLWTVLIWGGGAVKALSNGAFVGVVNQGVNNGAVPPQQAAAAVNWADRLWVFAAADVLLGLLPYFGEREYPRGHAAIVAVALVVTVVGLSVREWLVRLVLNPPVTLVPPSVSACLSAYSSKYLWTLLIWVGGAVKAVSNGQFVGVVDQAVNNGAVPPQQAAAAVNWAGRLWVFAAADVLLGLLPYFGEREYPRGHVAIVAVALVITVAGLCVRVWLVRLVLNPPVTLVPPTISACLSAYASKYLWSVLIWGGGAVKALSNGQFVGVVDQGVNNGAVPPQQAAAAVNWAGRLWVFAAADVLLGLLPYFGEREYPRGHVAIVAVALVVTVAGLCVRVWLVHLMLNPPVTLVPPTVSACLSAYSSKYLWTLLIWGGGAVKALSNGEFVSVVNQGVNNGAVPPQQAAAAVNWADRLWVFATADVLLGLLPYFGEREYPRGHAAIVAVALVITVVGLSVRVWLDRLVLNPPGWRAILLALLGMMVVYCGLAMAWWAVQKQLLKTSSADNSEALVGLHYSKTRLGFRITG